MKRSMQHATASIPPFSCAEPTVQRGSKLFGGYLAPLRSLKRFIPAQLGLFFFVVSNRPPPRQKTFFAFVAFAINLTFCAVHLSSLIYNNNNKQIQFLRR